MWSRMLNCTPPMARISTPAGSRRGDDQRRADLPQPDGQPRQPRMRSARARGLANDARRLGPALRLSGLWSQRRQSERGRLLCRYRRCVRSGSPRRSECRAEQVLLYGRSLGTGVAVELASRRRHRALLLVAPYTSLPDVAVRRFGLLPAPLLMRNRFPSVDKIARCTQPLFIIHGTDDHVKPRLRLGKRNIRRCQRTEAVHARGRRPTRRRAHNRLLSCGARFPGCGRDAQGSALGNRMSPRTSERGALAPWRSDRGLTPPAQK